MTRHTRHRRSNGNDWILWMLLITCCLISAFIAFPVTKAMTGELFIAVVVTIATAAILCIGVWQIWTQLDDFKGKRKDDDLPVPKTEEPIVSTIEIHNHNVNVNALQNQSMLNASAVANAHAESPTIPPNTSPTPMEVHIDNHVHIPETKKDTENETMSEPLQDELDKRQSYRIWDMVDALDKELVLHLPEELQNRDALFALVMLRDAGYLDNSFMPVADPGKEDIHRTNYSFIAIILGCALELNNKWQVFQKAWGIKNMRNLYEKIKKPDMSHATPFEIGVVNVLREARQLNPKLNSADLHYFINKCPLNPQ